MYRRFIARDAGKIRRRYKIAFVFLRKSSPGIDSVGIFADLRGGWCVIDCQVRLFAHAELCHENVKRTRDSNAHWNSRLDYIIIQLLSKCCQRLCNSLNGRSCCCRLTETRKIIGQHHTKRILVWRTAAEMISTGCEWYSTRYRWIILLFDSMHWSQINVVCIIASHHRPTN